MQPVLNTFKRLREEGMVRLTVGDEVIETTDDHPFWVVEGKDLESRPVPKHCIIEASSNVNGRWCDAGYVNVGDFIFRKDALHTGVYTQPVITIEKKIVYNIEVLENNNYAVGKNTCLVHNRTAKLADGPYIIIGESMDKVKASGRKLKKDGVDVRWWQSWKKNWPDRPMTKTEYEAAKKRNLRWLDTKVKQGCKVIDRGFDYSRAKRGNFYGPVERGYIDKGKIPTIPLPRKYK